MSRHDENLLVRDVERSLLGEPRVFRKGMWVKDKKNRVGRIELVSTFRKTGAKYAVVVYMVPDKNKNKQYRVVKRSCWCSDLRPT